MSGSVLISNLKKAIFTLSLFFLISFTSVGQNVIGVVDYLKVDDAAKFTEAEKEWYKVREEQIKEGSIVGWVVYQVMFKTTEDLYNYISVTFYDSFSKLDKGINDEVLEAAFPGLDHDEIDERIKNIEASRKLISSVVFHRRLTAKEKLDLVSNYYVISEINVKQGKSKEYINIKGEIYNAVHKEEIDQDYLTAWSLWEKWPGNMKDFQYVDVSGYESLEQIDNSHFKEYFSKVHPDMDMADIGAKVEDISALINTEMWKVVLRIYK